MELLSPAGNKEKLSFAYRYGADAVYIGLDRFSLRSKADNFSDEDPDELKKIKGDKKLYCALNIYFHPGDLEELEKQMEKLKRFSFDAFIVSDIGAVPLLRSNFPDMPLHLSTQANCVNQESAKLYRDLGFSRVILGRELSLQEIARVKGGVPTLELEAFVHGAMCISYSGRCFLSSWMAGRSGNKGDCAHSCRWNYRVLEEQERPGEFYPIMEDDGFTTILSSKDLCMIDHLREMEAAGIDSIKIEGRMKSVYYTAVATRAYRKMIDAVIYGKEVPDLEGFRDELFNVSHREFSTGFFFGHGEIDMPAAASYIRNHLLLGTVKERKGENRYEIDVKNSIYSGDAIEYLGPDVVCLTDDRFSLYSAAGEKIETAHHEKPVLLETTCPIEPGYIIRKPLGKS
jgi:U32 family peptidase